MMPGVFIAMLAISNNTSMDNVIDRCRTLKLRSSTNPLILKIPNRTNYGMTSRIAASDRDLNPVPSLEPADSNPIETAVRPAT